MLFLPTELPGAYVLDPERVEDSRGFFARTWCPDEFARHGLNPRLAQCSIAQNRLAGTLRGMHYQAPPDDEAKVVRCTAGAIFDVAVDLRHGSPTRNRWIGVELTEANRRALYVPEGCAHGYVTLTDDTEVFYMISRAHAPGSARGVRWDDPAFGIRWPVRVRVISERDRTYPDHPG